MATPTLIRTKSAARRRRATTPSAADVQHFVFEDASWELYEQLLRESAEGTARITFDDGRLEITSPPPEHERPKRAVGRMIEQLTLELRIPIASFGSTTFRRRDRRKGVEPDECYYVAHERQMRGRRRLNLKRDPPPDLVIEVDITSPSVPREPIYAALGVPELWRWDGQTLECRHLVDGRYRSRKRSLSSPFLEPADLRRFVKLARLRGETAAIPAFVAWVRKQGWPPPAAG